jgi:ankyrin repeat protein
MDDVFSFVVPNVKPKSICLSASREILKIYIKRYQNFVFAAIEHNDLKTVSQVKFTIQNYDNINKVIDNGYVKMLKILMEQKGIKLSVDHIEFCRACEKGMTGIVRLLLPYLNVETALSNFPKAIQIAAENGFEEILRMILNDPLYDPIYNCRYAMEYASQNGHVAIVRLLLSDKHTYIGSNNKSLMHATTNGHVEVVRLLLADKRIDPSRGSDNVIINASSHGHVDIVRMLLADNRVDPAAEDNSAIRDAVVNGHTEVVRLLLADKRVDPSDCDDIAIHTATEKGYVEIVRLLLADSRVNPANECNNNSAIERAALDGRTEIFKLLLADKRVDPSIEGADAAIVYASSRGYTDMVRMLLEDKRTIPSHNNNMAIKEAIKNHHIDIVKMLSDDPRINLEDISKELDSLVEQNKRISQIIEVLTASKNKKLSKF